MPDVVLDIKAKDQTSNVLKQIQSRFLSVGAGIGAAMALGRAAMKGFEDLLKNVSKHSKEFQEAQADLKKTQNTIADVMGKNLGPVFADITKKMNEFLKSEAGIKIMSNGIAILITAFKMLGQFVGNTMEEIQLFSETIRIYGELLNILFGEEDKTLSKTEQFQKKFAAFMMIPQVPGEMAKKQFAIMDKAARDSANVLTDYKKTVEEIQAQMKAGFSTQDIKKGAAAIAEAGNKAEGAAVDLKALTDAAAASGEQAKKVEDNWKQAGMNIANAFANAFGKIGGMVNDFYEGQKDTIQNSLDAQLASIDENMNAQLEMYGLMDETKSQMAQRELSELESLYAKEKNALKRKELSAQITTKQAELQKAKIVEDAEAQKTEAKKQAAMKEYQLSVDQFNANKAIKIVDLWVNTALGIATLWANSMSLGPIAGPIAAGIVTALLLGIAGAETGIIASQQPPPPPAFAEGGISSGGMALVGERGRELVNLPSGSQITNNTLTERLLGNGISVNVQVFLDSLSIPISKILTENRRMEIARA